MALFEPSEFRLGESLRRLAYANPFLPERGEIERAILGKEYIQEPWVLNRQPDWEVADDFPNTRRIATLTEQLVTRMRHRLAEGVDASETELFLYEDVVLYHLYRAERDEFLQEISNALRRKSGQIPVVLWNHFRSDFDDYMLRHGRPLPTNHEPEHVFACFFQFRRAFYQIFENLVGNSEPAARLRATVWRSIFTHDLRRYARSLYDVMRNFSTLITGPSGTGKELVARALAQSRYIPFCPKKRKFEQDFAESFHPVVISALPAALIESELFGHKKGSFTGALEDRKGRLDEEVCQSWGTVFLDEIGDLQIDAQVKLLRVLETRNFQRVGETDTRNFVGKVIAATNRDLKADMRAGKFRSDLYYRLCGDLIRTPSLHEQLHDAPGDLRNLIQLAAVKIFDTENGDELAAELAEEVETWVDQHLGRNYEWPGNFRELQQCVRNILIHKEYHKADSSGDLSDRKRILADEFLKCDVTADELERRYCTLAYAKTGSFVKAAERLGLDRRTVRARIDEELLKQLSDIE